MTCGAHHPATDLVCTQDGMHAMHCAFSDSAAAVVSWPNDSIVMPDSSGGGIQDLARKLKEAPPPNPAVAAATSEAMGRAYDHADDEWRGAARQAVIEVAHACVDFTADDVWEVLATSSAGTHNPSALGPVLTRLASDGWIEKTGERRQTRLARRHRDLTVWRSTARNP